MPQGEVFWPLQPNSEVSRVPTDFQVPISGVWVSSSHSSQSRVATFNLETLLMLGIFGKWPPNRKMLSIIYQYNRQVDLIGNYHNFI
jgi:hypothetical protein